MIDRTGRGAEVLFRAVVIVFAAINAVGGLAGCAADPSAPSARASAGAASPVATPTPVTGASTEPRSEPCSIDAVELLHGRVDGAAGSRFTRVELSILGTEPCAVPARPTFELLDAAGMTIMTTTPGGASAVVEVEPGMLVTSNVRLADWCLPPPAEPLALILTLDDGSLLVGGGPFPEPSGLQPCVGGALILEATDWLPG